MTYRDGEALIAENQQLKVEAQQLKTELEGLRVLEALGNAIAEVLISTYWAYGLLRSTVPEDLTPFLKPPPTDDFVSVLMLVLHTGLAVTATLCALKLTGLGQRVL